MLRYVDGLVAQGRLVERRQVPGVQDCQPEPQRERRSGEDPQRGVRAGVTQQRLEGRAGKGDDQARVEAEQQKRRGHAHQQSVLQHVRRDEVLLRDGVERRL
jgi:hypothetical protein